MAAGGFSVVEPARSGRFPAARHSLAAMSPLERAAVGLLVLLTLASLAAPWMTPYDPQLPIEMAYLPPSLAHPFGTDEIGRDLLSRVILGTRLTWLPGMAIITIGLVIGSTIGLLAGAFGGWVDTVLQRLTDLFLVIPATLVALASVATLGAGSANVVLAVSIFWWPWYARIMRAEIMAIAAQPHVEAARLAGIPGWRVLLFYMLPGAIPSLVVAATLDVANVILLLALFSFLGLGAPAPAPELGSMVASNLASLTTEWWLPLLPACVIFLLAFAANLAGDGMRKALHRM